MDYGLWTARRGRQRGYALVMTLVLLMLASLATLGLARRSLVEALHARLGEEELQRRWGTLTLRSHLLPQAEALLAKKEKEAGKPCAVVTGMVELSGLRFEFTLTDEQAKANVNTLYQRVKGDRQEALIAVERLVEASTAMIRLRPYPEGPEGRFESYGQVFSQEVPRLATERLTCWGDGKVHLFRASEPVLKEMLRGSLDSIKIDQLLALRKSSIPLAEAVVRLQLSQDEAQNLASLCTETSASHGLWVRVSSARGSRTTLDVHTAGQRHHFGW